MFKTKYFGLQRHVGLVHSDLAECMRACVLLPELWCQVGFQAVEGGRQCKHPARQEAPILAVQIRGISPAHPAAVSDIAVTLSPLGCVQGGEVIK